MEATPLVKAPEIILDSEPTWKTQTLSEFIAYNCPSGWEEFFDLEETWKVIDVISRKLTEEKRQIWPELPELLNAFYMCPYTDLKVIILGQDPYHSPKTAYGLSFSARPGGPVPASLRNVFAKLRQEGYTTRTPYLGSWANQGVFLINTALTVAQGCPESHLDIWEPFTNLLLKYLKRKEKVVWILWGKKAQLFRGYVPIQTCTLIEGGHPSPLNSTGSFMDSNYFNVCNAKLQKYGHNPINWNL